MKVIDLLNKIANGEETPDRFIYDGMLFERHLDNYYQHYDRGNNISNIVQFSEEICSDYSNLNDEIEIPEDTPKEDKKIEELSTWFAISDTPTLDGVCKYIDHNTEMFYNKINELVRKVNGEDNE